MIMHETANGYKPSRRRPEGQVQHDTAPVLIMLAGDKLILSGTLSSEATS
jgi:hypothetical protein